MRLSNEIHSALYDEDIAGLEQIIKKVGAEAAFGVFLTEDFSGRRLIHYMENYPSGLREYRTGIHPEFLALALKYDPELKLGRRLRYLHVCDSFLGRMSVGRFRRTRMAPVSGIDQESVVKFRKLILDSAPAEEKILMQKLCLIKGEYHSKPE